MSLDCYLEILAEEKRSEEMKKEALSSFSDEDLVKKAFNKTAKEGCPGSKIRSRGAGRGLGRGKAKGPIGVPAKLKGTSYKGPLTKASSIDKEALWEKVVEVAKSLPGKISNKASQVKSTYQAGANPLGEGVAGPLPKGQGGFGGGLKAVATQHPGVTAGAVGTAGLGTGYALAPSSQKTAAIFSAGDRAGRILAKVAYEAIPMEELQESIEEARAREDPVSRARKAMIAGSIGAGTVGGASGALAGYGLGRALRLPRAASSALGGALGTVGAGYAGGRFGKGYGEQEALADKAISSLRAARAAQLGYGAGLETGYHAGRGS